MLKKKGVHDDRMMLQCGTMEDPRYSIP